MIRKLVSIHNKALRKKSKPVKKVDKKIIKLVKDMKETLLAQKNPEGVGLAAPQIGINLQIFIMNPGKEYSKKNKASFPLAIINPEIISIKKPTRKEMSERTKILEGCLSLPNYYGPLKRANKVKIKYLTEEGEEKKEEFTEFLAQIVLHEIDHLNGILFVDRLLEQNRTLYESKNGEWIEVGLE